MDFLLHIDRSPCVMRRAGNALSKERRKRHARRRQSLTSRSEDGIDNVQDGEGPKKRSTDRSGNSKHTHRSRTLSLDQQKWVEKHSERLYSRRSGATSDAKRRERKLKASFRKFCSSRASLQALRLFCKEHIPLYR